MKYIVLIQITLNFFHMGGSGNDLKYNVITQYHVVWFITISSNILDILTYGLADLRAGDIA